MVAFAGWRGTGFILTVFGFVPYTLFGVAWHRLTLLGPGVAAPVTFPSWKNRHTRFFGYVLAVTGLAFLIFYFPSVAMSGMAGTGGPAISVPVMLMMTGKPDLGPIIGGYLGAVFLGAYPGWLAIRY